MVPSRDSPGNPYAWRDCLSEYLGFPLLPGADRRGPGFSALADERLEHKTNWGILINLRWAGCPCHPGLFPILCKFCFPGWGHSSQSGLFYTGQISVDYVRAALGSHFLWPGLAVEAKKRTFKPRQGILD